MFSASKDDAHSCGLIFDGVASNLVAVGSYSECNKESLKLDAGGPRSTSTQRSPVSTIVIGCGYASKRGRSRESPIWGFSSTGVAVRRAELSGVRKFESRTKRK